jgi:hypothetical protein
MDDGRPSRTFPGARRRCCGRSSRTVIVRSSTFVHWLARAWCSRGIRWGRCPHQCRASATAFMPVSVWRMFSRNRRRRSSMRWAARSGSLLDHPAQTAAARTVRERLAHLGAVPGHRLQLAAPVGGHHAGPLWIRKYCPCEGARALGLRDHARYCPFESVARTVRACKASSPGDVGSRVQPRRVNALRAPLGNPGDIGEQIPDNLGIRRHEDFNVDPDAGDIDHMDHHGGCEASRATYALAIGRVRD